MKPLIRSFGFQAHRVDLEKRIIKGLLIARAGVGFDRQTLLQIAELGNAGNRLTGSIRARIFRLESASLNQPVEKVLGIPCNFRVEGDAVLADLPILGELAAPSGSQFLALASEAPELICAKLAFKAFPQTRRDAPIRIEALFAIEFTDLDIGNTAGLFAEPTPPRQHVVKKHASRPVLNPELVQQIRVDAVHEEQIYRAQFAGILDYLREYTPAGFAEHFEKNNVGSPIEEIRYRARRALAMKDSDFFDGLKASWPGSAKTPDQIAADLEQATVEAARKRYATNKDLRMIWTRYPDDPEHPNYQAGLARYIAAEKKWARDQERTLPRQVGA